MIVGTAGHIDHGKTTLVRALTGVDTDRLPEEKRRGISIELGYAFLPVAGGAPIGFVDVPGHEKLVHTMLAGATGMDAILLLIAADDGVMPQTREHLAIASLLGIARGAVVLTKCDRVPPARVQEVRTQAAELVKATVFEATPVFATSAPDGGGLEPLRAWLLAEAASTGERGGANRAFRLAVDRVFTIAGAGTVVTGTVFAGTIAPGDAVRIAPTGRQARVRSVHAQGRPSDGAQAGVRCALNLAGLDRDQIARGHWICDPGVAAARERLDARVEVWPGQPLALRSGQTVHLHLGAADVLARVVALQADRLQPGEGGWVQLVLQQPVGAWLGDRFVLRDGAARQTLAGGRVLDPSAPARYRKSPERLAQLAALELADPRARLAQTLEAELAGLGLDRIRRDWALIEVAPMLPANAIRIGQGGEAWAVAESRWHAMLQKLQDSLAQQHRQEPESMGVEAGRLKRMAVPRTPAVVADGAIEALVASGRMLRQAAFLQLPEHAMRLSEQEQRLVQRVVPLIEEGGSDPPWVRDLARDLKQPEAQVRATLAHHARQGEVFQVVRDLYVHRRAIEKLASTARELAARDGAVRAALFRDATGLGRKRAIQFLEFFDRIGLLRRVRDDHYVRPGTQLFGQDASGAEVRSS